MGCYKAFPRGTMTNLAGLIRQLQKERQRADGEMKRLDAALSLPWEVSGIWVAVDG